MAAALPGSFRVIGLAARSKASRVIGQAVQFGVKTVALADPAAGLDPVIAPVLAEQPELRRVDLGGTVEAGLEAASRLFGVPAPRIPLVVLGVLGAVVLAGEVGDRAE